jgi:cytochrome P450
LLRPQFAREQVGDLDLEERHVQKAMQVMPLIDGHWTGPVDIQTIFFRFTLDSATDFFFGKSVESQLSVLTDRHTVEDKFCDYLTTAQRYAAQRVRFERVAWLLHNKESRKAENEVHKYVDQHVKRAIDAVQEDKNNAHNPDRYLFLNALAEATQDPIELRSELLLTVMAGRDTTASMLTWTILLLARHTNEFQKLREIILAEFGSYGEPKNLTFQSLKSCRYLQYVMNESLRLYPVAPFNTRTAVTDTTLPRGGGDDGLQPIFVRKGQVIAYTVHVLHRRKDIWGVDADEFIPSRWATSKAGWDYLPFNGGPRICLGQQFALTNVGYVLVRLLQRFDAIENVNAGKEIREILTLGSFPAENLCVRLRESSS